MSEFRVGSVEWKLTNRTAERDALQELVDKLQRQLEEVKGKLAVAEGFYCRFEQTAEHNKKKLTALQAELSEAQRQLEVAWAEFRALSVRDGETVAKLQRQLADARKSEEIASEGTARLLAMCNELHEQLTASQQREQILKDATYNLMNAALRVLSEEKE